MNARNNIIQSARLVAFLILATTANADSFFDTPESELDTGKCKLPAMDSYHYREKLDALIKPLWSNDGKRVTLRRPSREAIDSAEKLSPGWGWIWPEDQNSSGTCIGLRAQMLEFYDGYARQIWTSENGEMQSGSVMGSLSQGLSHFKPGEAAGQHNEVCWRVFHEYGSCGVKKKLIAWKAFLTQEAAAWFDAAQEAYGPLAEENRRVAEERKKNAVIAAEKWRLEEEKLTQERKIKEAKEAERRKAAKIAANKKAGEAAAAYQARRADLISGKAKIESCEDAAIKYEATNAMPILLNARLGGRPNESGYFYASNFFIAQNDRDGDKERYLIVLTSYAAIIRTDKKTVNRVGDARLTICAVGSFSGYESLADGRSVAVFDGVYIGP